MSAMRPVICMITDRRRAVVSSAEALIDRVAVAAHAGVDLVQVRERDLNGGALAHLVQRCLRAVRGTRTRVIVNDRLDVTLAVAADGVHLRSDSFGAARVRAIVPSRILLGRSVHNAVEAAHVTAHEGLDYLICGTIFETVSKPGRGATGLAMLADTVRATAIPVIAVGGITADNAAQVAATGAAGIAAIGLFADCSLDILAARVEAVGHAFATRASDVP